MLGELQSFRWHKGLHCDNSLFCEGPEALSAQPGRHSRTTAGIHSALYTLLCNERTSSKDKAKLLSYCLINKEGKIHQWLLFALGHSFCMPNPGLNIEYVVECQLGKPIPCRPPEPRRQRQGVAPLSSYNKQVKVVPKLVRVCSWHLYLI